MIHLKVEKIGDAVAVVLDEATQAALGVKLGDMVAVEQAIASGEDSQTETDRQLALAREVMADYCETLDELAK